MLTRQDYIDGKCTFDDYYGQFVTDTIRFIVEGTIGVERIMRSTDPHLNDISLYSWDRLEPLIKPLIKEQMKKAGDHVALSSVVCVAKTAAKLIRKDIQNGSTQVGQ